MLPAPQITRHVRRLGAEVLTHELRNRLSSQDVNFGLRADLDHLPAPRSAKVPVSMEPCNGYFDGFDAELKRTTGADYARTLRRRRLHQLGVRTMHVAWTGDREPLYVQWLVTPADQHLVKRYASAFWRPLGPGEVLLEFAYAFIAARGKGVMADAMGQLVRLAAETGAKSAFTYVRWDNVPSLRGCAAVGFDLDHVRVTTVRLGAHRNRLRPADEHDREVWRAATAPRERT